uniref:Late embryogenesis abundant protein LEA-2 subgroup domain-containing protein n=1 Tax=Arundo donax TaxID=35708 RepID=A0A0A9BUU5_ARUDO
MPMADEGQGKSWKTNHYILAALGGTLAVTAIITIISIILSPAHITFSVTRASYKIFKDGTVNLNVTITAYNPSHRREAKYQSVFIDLKNSTTAEGKTSIHANIPDGTFPTSYLRGPNVTLINASVLLVDLDGAYTRRLNGSGLVVVVRALVRFKVGVTPTRLYEMKVSCPGVLFSIEGSNYSAHQRNFNCSG